MPIRSLDQVEIALLSGHGSRKGCRFGVAYRFRFLPVGGGPAPSAPGPPPTEQLRSGRIAVHHATAVGAQVHPAVRCPGGALLFGAGQEEQTSIETDGGNLIRKTITCHNSGGAALE
ncbi:hypothetical protein GCM10010347_41440 [Streptomyces cirratus]|uniref:Uncharacterized protein n=1 Tax=Streptomyces cirratus TaxID=68187 RepID=A0ABQ3F326_9ACTN|nr:hypothetical protein GCM10010347_41440 [Streptomyces cirratus]